MSTPAPPLLAQRAWGIAAVTIAVLSVLPTVFVVILAATADDEYGWFLFLSIPVLMGGAVIAMLTGLVGVIFAAARRRGFVWPTVGTALGIGLLAVVGAVLAFAN